MCKGNKAGWGQFKLKSSVLDCTSWCACCREPVYPRRRRSRELIPFTLYSFLILYVLCLSYFSCFCRFILLNMSLSTGSNYCWRSLLLWYKYAGDFHGFLKMSVHKFFKREKKSRENDIQVGKAAQKTHQHPYHMIDQEINQSCHHNNCLFCQGIVKSDRNIPTFTSEPTDLPIQERT